MQNSTLTRHDGMRCSWTNLDHSNGTPSLISNLRRFICSPSLPVFGVRPFFCSSFFFPWLAFSPVYAGAFFVWESGFRLKNTREHARVILVFLAVWCAASPVHARVAPRLAMQGFAFTVVPTRARAHTHTHTHTHQIQMVREQLKIPEPAHGHRRTRKLRARSDLFPEPGASTETLHNFLAKLAGQQVCGRRAWLCA